MGTFARRSDVEAGGGRITLRGAPAEAIVTDYTLFSRLPVMPNMRVLDIGCGTGRDIRALIRNHPDYTCVGVDQYMHRLIDGEPLFEFIQQDIRSPLPFDDKSFDLVYTNSVLCELNDDDEANAVIAEMLRVGKDVWYTELELDLSTFRTIHATPFTFNKFVILGSPRTGTTLLVNLLSQHPELQCYHEKLSYSYLNDTSLVACMKPNIGIKLPWLSDKLAQFPLWSTAKIVYTKRTIVDSVASLLILDQEQRVDEDTPAFLDYMANERADVIGPIADMYADPDEKRVAIAAAYVKLIDGFSALYTTLEVNYDDLVTDPDTILSGICGYLGVQDFTFDTSGVYQDSIGKGSLTLTDRELEIVNQVVNG